MLQAATVLGFVRDLVPVTRRPMVGVGLASVRHAYHVHVGCLGVMRLDVALQLVDQRAMRLSGIGERLRPV